MNGSEENRHASMSIPPEKIPLHACHSRMTMQQKQTLLPVATSKLMRVHDSKTRTRQHILLPYDGTTKNPSSSRHSQATGIVHTEPCPPFFCMEQGYGVITRLLIQYVRSLSLKGVILRVRQPGLGEIQV